MIKDCWPYMTLPLPPLSCMHNLRYKNYFGNRVRALLTEAWSPHVVLFLSFSYSGWSPWSAGALCVHFPAWASKTHSRRCLRWGTFRDSRGCLWPTWTEQVPCRGFISFLRKPRNISLFSLLYFLNCRILSLSLYLFFRRRRPLEGILGSNRGWTLVLKNRPVKKESGVQYPGEGNGNPLQYSCLGNPMDRGTWRATVHEDDLVPKWQQQQAF